MPTPTWLIHQPGCPRCRITVALARCLSGTWSSVWRITTPALSMICRTPSTSWSQIQKMIKVSFDNFICSFLFKNSFDTVLSIFQPVKCNMTPCDGGGCQLQFFTWRMFEIIALAILIITSVTSLVVTTSFWMITHLVVPLNMLNIEYLIKNVKCKECLRSSQIPIDI